MRVRIRRFNENNAVGCITPASDFPIPRAGNGSTLRSNPTGFTCFVCSVVPLPEGFCLLRSSHELLTVLILSLFGPSQKKLLVLWPLLTSATSACPLEQGYFPARWQTSPGKNADFPCTPALFTALALGRIGLRCYLPTRPASQPHRVRVPQVAGLLPASSRLRLTTTPLPSANGWCDQPP